MAKSKMANAGIDIITSFVLFLFIVSFSVTFTLHFKPLYYWDIDLLKIAESSGVEKEEIIENYDTLIDYNSMFSKEELEFPSFVMSEGGRIHFEEVKVIFVYFQQMALICGLLALALIVLHVRKKSYRFLKLTSIITILIPCVLGGAIAINWDYAFVAFHKIAFDNDYWIFDATTDPVITILPDTFFLHCAAMILLLVIVGSVVCLVSYKKMEKKSKNE